MSDAMWEAFLRQFASIFSKIGEQTARLGSLEKALEEKVQRDDEQNRKLDVLTKEMEQVNAAARRSIRVEPKWVALCIVLTIVLMLVLAQQWELLGNIVEVFK